MKLKKIKKKISESKMNENGFRTLMLFKSTIV